MAKKKSASRADAVRDAVDQAFKTQIPRERLSDLLDEIGSTAGRLRGAVDELRPATEAEIKELRAEIETLRSELAALRARVEPLEAAPAGAPARRVAAARKPPAKKPAAAKRRAAAKPSAAKPPAEPRARKSPPDNG